MFKKNSIAALLMLVSTIALASGLSVEQAQRFISLSGLDQSIAAMPDMVRQQTNLKMLVENDKVTASKAAVALEEAISRINGIQIAEEYLLESADASALKETISFLESDLGRTITAAEAKANSPDFQVEMQRYVQELSQNPPEDDRMALVQSLNEALDVEGTILKMAKTMMFTMVDAMAELQPEAAPVLREELEAQWDQMAPMLSAQMSQYATMASYYSYGELTDQELSAYISFLKSDAGKVYYSASIEIFQRYADQMVRNLVQVLSENES